MPTRPGAAGRTDTSVERGEEGLLLYEEEAGWFMVFLEEDGGLVVFFVLFLGGEVAGFVVLGGAKGERGRGGRHIHSPALVRHCPGTPEKGSKKPREP